MPKEIVYGAYGEFTIDEQGNEVGPSSVEPGQGAQFVRRGVVLRWSKDHEHVELTTTKINTADHNELGGQYVQMTRSGINKLIRDLRRARDQAFGKDE